MRSLVMLTAAAALGFAAAYVFLAPDTVNAGAKMAFGSFGGAGCNIKGNVSINSGERIYHMPGQEYYSATNIDGRFGERWFCSENDAREAGWRRSLI